MYKYILLLIALVSQGVYSQTSTKYSGEYVNFYRAEELFAKEQYAAARIEFRNFVDQATNAADPMVQKALYYEGLSALELYNADAVKLLQAFNKKYPESIYRKDIYFKLAKHFFTKKEFKEVLSWMRLLGPDDFEKPEKQEYYFKLGYAHFQLRHLPEARSAFYEVKDDTSSIYRNSSLYYYSHIAFEEKLYTAALKGFLDLQSTSYAAVVPLYITQIQFLLGNYKEVTQYAPTIPDSLQLKNKKELDHIIGTSYYRINDFQSSIPYLESYQKLTEPTADDRYQLGYAYLRTKNFEKSVKEFGRLTSKKDSLAQLAFYHQAEGYAALKDKKSAQAAFERASEMNFNRTIQEDALYNFAVLSYELDINPYDEAVTALEAYIKNYPNSKRINEINQYLVNVYTSTNNYAKALASLDKIQNKDTKLKFAYQLVAFNQGVEYYQKGDYKQAIKSFDLVEKYPIDPTISGKGKFWKGDAYYRQNDMPNAIKFYKEFIGMQAAKAASLKQEAYYNIGYANLALANAKKDQGANQFIDQAIEAFRNYCQSNVTNQVKLADANMRAADCYYMIRDNENAIKFYKAAFDLKAGFEDQALFFMAKACGYADRDADEIAYYLQLFNSYPTSKYRLQTINEIALNYKVRSEYDNSIRYFNKLIEEFPNSVLVVNALVEIADIHFKQWQYAKAEAEYKQILETYGEDREICQKAARGLIDVYSLGMKQPDLANNVVIDYPCADFTLDEQEALFYNPGFSAYQDKNHLEAITSFKKYIEKFPQGKFNLDAKFYIADSYGKLGDSLNAVEYFKEIAALATNSYTEESSTFIANYYYGQENYTDAIPFFEQIEKISSKPGQINHAKQCLMVCHYSTSNWLNAVAYSKMVLDDKQITNEVRIYSNYILGMAQYMLENATDAIAAFTAVANSTTDEMSVESRFYIAELWYKQNDYVKADAEALLIIKNPNKYDYWIAKAVLLQSRIQLAQNDFVKAEQLVTKVINKYPHEGDGIMEEATALLEEINQLKNPKRVEETEVEDEVEINEN